MTMTEQLSATATATPTTWQPAERKSSKPQKQTHDDDAIIDAYLAGHKEGYDHGFGDMQRGLSKLLKQNATKAALHTQQVLQYLKQNHIAAVNAYLKLSSWDELNVMVLVSQESFVQPSFREVYNLVYEIEDACEQEDWSLTFSFAPHSNDFNIGCLHADGFSLRYVTEATAVKKAKAKK